ncbi:MAG TPA: glycosyltransferase family 39 protein, partial [Chloroflexota bacterium]|nr:glycosyltransferase family 39 protein [Chloroflexota bacterium]
MKQLLRRRWTPPSALLWTILLALLFIAFAARVWKLGAQSLWLDEALSVVFARADLRQVLAILVYQDLHPPLYYLALHFWMKIAGESEFSVRFVSVLLGLPVVPATYQLGRSLFQPHSESDTGPSGPDTAVLIGLVGATLTAVSPFLVYYAQEARMYSALVTFCVLSTWALWKYLRTGERRWWVAYAVFTALTLYTQYFGALVIAFQVLYLVGQIRGSRRARGAFGALGVTALAYVPWLPGAYLQVQRLLNVPDFWKGDFQLSYLVEHIFAAFAFGQFTALRDFRMLAL